MILMPKINVRLRVQYYILAILLLFASFRTNIVNALSSGELRAQSNNIQAEIENNKVKAQELANQASSLRRTIENLDLEIDSQSKQIELLQIEIESLNNDLDKANTELERQKSLLKAALRALYERRGASTVELLIASDSFSDFISEQEYLQRLQASIKQSTDQVVQLAEQIKVQKAEQEVLKVERERELSRLETTKNERSDLLVKTEGQESEYQNMVSQLVAEQAEVNRQLFLAIQLESGDGNNGGYPYDDWPFSMDTPGCPAGDGPDRWGYCTRQCVSYAAWAVERSGKKAPMYWGNAKNWKWHGEAEGKQVDRTPEEGAVAVYTSGGFGHVQYVEAVYGNGTMRISQYNAQLSGKYSEATVSSSRYDLWFVHF